VGLFDWLGTGRRDEPVPSVAWHVYREAGDIVAEDGHGARTRVPLSGARSIRVVPLTGGNHHRDSRGGWQVALSRAEGDVLVGKPVADWRAARQLAQLLCETSELPLDELTEKMFSRVGQYTPAREA
jgi:hypothetical protein